MASNDFTLLIPLTVLTVGVRHLLFAAAEIHQQSLSFFIK